MSAALSIERLVPGGGEPQAPRIRVLVIGGSTLFRSTIGVLVNGARGIEFAGLGASLAEGLRDVRGDPPDVIVLDPVGSDSVVFDALNLLLRRGLDMRVLIVTARLDPEIVGRMVDAGAHGVLFKDETFDKLLTAIRKVHEGEFWIDRATTARIISGAVERRHKDAADPERAKLESLTPREVAVVKLVATGLNNKTIAARLNISDSTVRHHLTSIFAKVGVPDRLGLVIFAFRHDLVAPTG